MTISFMLHSITIKTYCKTSYSNTEFKKFNEFQKDEMRAPLFLFRGKKKNETEIKMSIGQREAQASIQYYFS